MILECPTQTLQETRGLVLETKRLTLRQPALADVKAIAAIVGDKRVSINLRRVPHPYTLDDATDFVTSSANSGETVFLVKNADEPIGLVGLEYGLQAGRIRLLPLIQPGKWKADRAPLIPGVSWSS